MPEPITLFDLRRRRALVDLGDSRQFEIIGLTAREVCDHLEDFPILTKLGTGTGFGILEAVRSAPGAIEAWAASALGYHRNKDAEAVVRSEMTIDQSTEICEASLGLTFSKGFGPFFNRLAGVQGYLTVDRGPASVMTSRSPSPAAARQSTNAHGTSPQGSSPPSSSSTAEKNESTKPS